MWEEWCSGGGGGMRIEGDDRWCVWRCISREQLRKLENTAEPGEVRGLLREWLVREDADGDVAEVLEDFHFYNLSFTREKRFTPEQASAFISIMKERCEEDAAWRDGIGAHMKLSFSKFKKVLLKHSVERPPWSIGLFGEEEMAAVMDYVLDSYYRHYSLYSYILSKFPVMEIKCTGPSGLEAPFEVPPLALAAKREEGEELPAADQDSSQYAKTGG